MTDGVSASSSVSALVLDGGKASRFGGIDKAALVIAGQTIFARQVAVLAPRVREILVSGRAFAGHRTVIDAVADAGPLAGIAAGLEAATTAWLLVVAGDMPNISGALIEALLAARAPGLDAVGIRNGSAYEPLVSLFRVATARPVVAARLAARRLAVQRLLTEGGLAVHWLDAADLRALDPTRDVLANINQPSDLPPA